MGGYQSNELNVVWDFFLDEEANVARGAVPSAGLLWWSRWPMAMLAVVSAALLFRLVAEAAGRRAGLVAMLLFAGSGYLRYTLDRAMGESTLVFGLLAALVATGYAVRGSWLQNLTARSGPVRWIRRLGWIGIAGVASGLAGAAKLNGIGILLACELAWLLACVRWRVQRQSRQFWLAIGGAAICAAGAATVFVGLNPYLYPDPISNTREMVLQRTTEMRTQADVFPQDHIGDLRTWVSAVPRRIFQDYATFRFRAAGPVNALLAIAGLWHAVRYAFERHPGRRRSQAACQVLLLGAASGAGPALMTPLDWDRYYLLPVVFCTAFVAVGVISLLHYLRGLLNWRGIRAGLR